MDVDPAVALRSAREVMKFRLARELHCTVAELNRRMSAHEFNRWAAFLTWERKQEERARG